MAGTILTNIGLSKLAAATPQNQLSITHIAVGDGNGGFPTLSPTMTSLTNEVWRGTASNPVRSDDEENVIFFEVNIPPEDGNFTIREVAIFDNAGEMIAIGHTSEIVKPEPTSESAFSLTARIFIALENASQVSLIYQDTNKTHHNTLTNRDASNSHPATAIRSNDGRSVEQRLIDLPAEVSAVVAAEADRAEVAADAATLSGMIYADTTAALAETVDGDYFSIVSTDSVGYLDLYLNDSGSAVFQKQYPSSGYLESATESIDQRVIPEFEWSIFDSSGRIAAGVKSNGTFAVAKLEDNNNPNYELPDGFSWGLLDVKGAVVLGVKSNGTVVNGSMITSKINNVASIGLGLPLSEGYFASEVAHKISYGQSLSIGVSGSPAITTAQEQNNVTFDSGLTAYIPLVEPAYGGEPDTETLCAGSSNAINTLIKNENGTSYKNQSYKLLASCAGEGGYSISGLEKGGIIYPRITDQITAGKSIANAANESYSLQAVDWVQGESDYNAGTSRAVYESALSGLLADIDADAKAITSQDDDVKMLTYQTASHIARGETYPTIALAQLDAIKNNPNIYGACPSYIFQYVGDNVHMTNNSYRLMGLYFGLAYKRAVIDKANPDVVRPISIKTDENRIYLKFNVPVKPLKFDITQVTKNTNYGFTVLDNLDTEVTQAAEPVIINNDTVKLTLNTNAVAGMKIQYAFYGTGSGETGSFDGARGNLRDSQGDYVQVDGSKLHNYSFIFEEIL